MLFRHASRLLTATLLLLLALPAVAEDIQLLVAPEGGFASVNRGRFLTYADGSTTAAKLNSGVLDLVERVPKGGAIKMALYNFDFDPVIDALVRRATSDEVQVKLILDGCAGWTDANVKDYVDRIRYAATRAVELGVPFDFQLNICSPAVMKKYGRTLVLKDGKDVGKEIVGTMHEKFGVFYDRKDSLPVHAFAGSSNLAKSAEDLYAENRLFFRDAPEYAKVFEAQFGRLWNLYSEPASGANTPEPRMTCEVNIPAEILFNGEHVGALADRNYVHIDQRILKLIDEVKPDGSLDLMMFSFTHAGLADKILEVAQKNPKAKFRLLFDHSMLDETSEKVGLQPPRLEKAVAEKKLANVEIRYKFRINAYAYDKEKRAVVHDHFRSMLLHHKLVIVNRDQIVFGSYNWSVGGEMRNFENAMIFKGSTPAGRDIIDRFLAEMNFLWDQRYEDVGSKGPEFTPMTLSGELGRKLQAQAIAALADADAQAIRAYLDQYGASDEPELLKETKIDPAKFRAALATLKAAGLVEEYAEGGKALQRLTD